MSDPFEPHLGAVTRAVTATRRDGKPAKSVQLTRDYATDIDDLWDALTRPERLQRWFLPVAGDLRPGGRFQLKGNAGGEILTCDPPDRLSVTWEFGGDTSWVDLTLEAEGDGTRFTLVHTALVNPFWDQYGPGAVGVGWDLGLLGLALHLTDPEARFDEADFGASAAGKAYVTRSAEDWGRADIAGGAAPEAARQAAANTAAFYRGEQAPGG
ncbi:SRPBCC family protein [Pseudooceanicola sp. LIPI14-2-Ac024]|uniref:SRPBCC family protein n=1 Tax=Pseudooceanicola sp. LIPI14-2-Ac024 TaxID=3344875 RepID=UPI0035CF25D5